MKKISNNIQVLLLLFFLLNLIQSLFTSIAKDEAYYWMFARHPDWGYFDHPPMVGLFILAGTTLFGGTLGVRLVTCIASVLTLFFLWRLVPEEDRKKENAVFFFFLVAFSMPVFHIYGFITTPDAPLLLFSVLYLHVFMQFLVRKNAINALKVGVVAAVLMYSKYHGAFLILFSIAANPRLLLNRYLYVAGIIGILLFLPHIFWQYRHDFISFRYHLIQRADGFMGGKHIMMYVLNTFLILNPFFFGLYLSIFRRKQIRSDMPKLLPVILWGFILFFGLNSFRDHIEPQWIGLATLPLTLILVRYLIGSGRVPPFFGPMAVISLVLIVLLRLGLVLPVPLDTEFHTQKAAYYQYIREKAGGAKVMFVNSYAHAARYTFYTGEPAFSYNGYDYRKNQYDLWDYEKDYHHQEVFCLADKPRHWAGFAGTVEGRTLYGRYISGFPMLNKVSGRVLTMDKTIRSERIHMISFLLKNPYEYPIVFNDSVDPVRFFMVFQKGRQFFLIPLGTGGLTVLEPGGERGIKGSYYTHLPAGEYQVAVGVQPGGINPLLITDKMKVEVE